jgi:PD-(D/E)XK nuclease superfamily
MSLRAFNLRPDALTTGEASVLIRELSTMRTLDLVERDADGGLVVVDLKTAARKYSDLQVEASLQLSIYSYATAMNGLADEADLRLRFDVLTKTRQPELHRYWATRDRAANVRLYRLAAEVLAAVDAGAFPPRVGWHCQDCLVRSRCWAWG